MHCNLRPPEPHASPFQLALYHCCLTLWFPFDLEYMHCIACDAMKLYQILTQSSNLRWSYCDFIIWPNDLEHHVTCCARLSNNFHQVWPSTTYPCLNCSVCMLLRCHPVTLTFDPLTLKVCGTSSITWSNSIRNVREIKQFSAKLLASHVVIIEL